MSEKLHVVLGSVMLLSVSLSSALEVQAEDQARAAVQQEARVDARKAAHKAAEEERKRKAAEKRREKEAKERADRERRKRLRSSSKPVSNGSPKSYARSLVSGSQWPCLEALWQKESGWRWNATNPSSGAYGIPQSLPGSKMASAGSDWRTNPKTQIRWGLGYIKSRYGTPCNAWAHSESVGWY